MCLCQRYCTVAAVVSPSSWYPSESFAVAFAAVLNCDYCCHHRHYSRFRRPRIDPPLVMLRYSLPRSPYHPNGPLSHKKRRIGVDNAMSLIVNSIRSFIRLVNIRLSAILQKLSNYLHSGGQRDFFPSHRQYIIGHDDNNDNAGHRSLQPSHSCCGTVRQPVKRFVQSHRC